MYVECVENGLQHSYSDYQMSFLPQVWRSTVPVDRLTNFLIVPKDALFTLWKKEEMTFCSMSNNWYYWMWFCWPCGRFFYGILVSVVSTITRRKSKTSQWCCVPQMIYEKGCWKARHARGRKIVTVQWARHKSWSYTWIQDFRLLMHACLHSRFGEWTPDMQRKSPSCNIMNNSPNLGQ